MNAIRILTGLDLTEVAHTKDKSKFHSESYKTKQLAFPSLCFEQCFKLPQDHEETLRKLRNLETSTGRTGDVIIPQNNIEALKKVVQKLRYMGWSFAWWDTTP